MMKRKLSYPPNNMKKVGFTWGKYLGIERKEAKEETKGEVEEEDKEEVKEDEKVEAEGEEETIGDNKEEQKQSKGMSLIFTALFT